MNDRTADLIATGLARLVDLPVDEVVEAKSSSPQIRNAADPEAIPLGDRKIRYVWSTETVDRMGDIVRQNWDLGAFSRNPVALYNHDHDLVLGRALDFGVGLAGQRRQLEGTIEFAPEGIDPLIDSRFKLAEAGFLPATSVGFQPKSVDRVTEPERRAELGLGDYGVVFEHNELMEISVVSVPANPEAVTNGLREAVERGILRASEAEMVARDTPPTEVQLRRRLSELRGTAPAEKREVALIDANNIFGALDALEGRMGAELAELRALIQSTRGAGTLTASDQDGPGSGRELDNLEALRRMAEQVSARLS